MGKAVQLHISQDEIERHMFSQNELCSGLTIEARLEEDNVWIDAWCVDESTNEEVSIKSNRLYIGSTGSQTAFLWCIFLGILTYLTNMLLNSPLWYNS